MEDRTQRIHQEATALWREVFGEPPPPLMDGGKMLEIITRCAADVTYDRLRSPFLRPSTIAGPAQPWDESRLR